MSVPMLVIGNKNYSSWSMRPWLALTHFGVAFEERIIPLDTPEFAAEVQRLSPSARVPCLIDGDLTVWESLSILEYVADRHPDLPLWPRDPKARAIARSVASEMHSGFQALRSACPMNLRKTFPFKNWGGVAAAKDVERITRLWKDCRARFGAGGPFLFGEFTAADAMFAPVTARLTGYSWPMDAFTAGYVEAVQGLPAFRAWKEAGVVEPWIVPDDEVQA